MDPWNIAGQITFRSGRRCYFRDTTLDLNPMGSSAIAKDKDYANLFMSRMGYPTIDGRTFFSPKLSSVVDPARNIDGAWRYAADIGVPVVVKPNSGTGGRGFEVVQTKRAFYRALRAIFRKDDVALVQRPVRGRDYRLVVLDRRVISAYERVPLNVVGDGVSDVALLLGEKFRRFRESGRDVNIDVDDPRIVAKLRRARLGLSSVLAAGERVYLLDNANLSSGGDSVDVSARAHPAFKDLAVRLTRDMGLRLCGVDLMVDGTLEQEPGTYWILEVNSAPGLDHYAQTGAAQRKIVRDLYLEVLKGMEK
ncbi:MAG: D-alanine--D-alanine ligase [Candidatus Eremiobacteraeota bacterium]|nr:D-alanine--D-alanine ligase [Candidatus Eremiobacteraeota bacterium]